MSGRTIVAGLGQKAAGDDGVGVAVLGELGRGRVPEGTALVHLADPMDLVALLEHGERVILVDAVLASPSGVVVELEPEDLSTNASERTSSHGLGAAQAIRLARALSNGRPPDLRVVAISIERPQSYGVGLSPEVSAAVREAADRVLALLEVHRA